MKPNESSSSCAAPADDGQPFFLFYNISPPHCPLADAPEKYLTMYRPADLPLRPNVDPDAPLANQDYWFKVYRWDFRYYSLHLPFAEHLPEGYTLRHLIAEYCGLVSWVDDTMGRLLAALDATGLASDTLVVFTSDHGDSLGSNGYVQKGTPNDESIRIPLILRGPGIGRRAIPGQVGSLVDLMPTLLDLAGGESPSHVHGQSLAPVLRGERDQLDRAHAFFETAGGAGVRSPTHTYYLAWAGEERRLEDQTQYFYDDACDPYQLHNLAGGEDQREAAARAGSGAAGMGSHHAVDGSGRIASCRNHV